MCSHRKTHSESQGQCGAQAPSHTPPKPGLPLPQSPPATRAHHPHPRTPPRPPTRAHLSMQIFSTWGTSTWSNLMMVCSGSFDFQERT